MLLPDQHGASISPQGGGRASLCPPPASFFGDPPSLVFVSPVQPALLPGSPRTDGFHVLIICLPQGRDKSDDMSKYTSSATNSQIPHITPLARNDT